VIARNLPDQVLKLAELVWYDDPRKRDPYEHHSTISEVESRFCISSTGTEYFPASAFQTPIFQLLRCSPKATLDFILSFTGRAAECYARSDFGDEVEEVEVTFGEEDSVKQYVSGRLWHAYRGMHTSTHLLESIHMGLEKWLLEQAKTASSTELEGVCKYLMRNSRSASITAVVASAVLSQPLKLFNVATILFRTKEFFFYDTARFAGELNSSLFTHGGGNFRSKIFDEERVEAAKAPHRKIALEHLALRYQVYQFEGEPEESVKERQRVLWKILDDYYAKLNNTGDTEQEKTWRLYLARMDSRKMKAEVKEENGQTVVQFIPQIDPDLKKFSEEAQEMSTDAMKYSALFLWSQARFRQDLDEQYKQYKQFEDDPHQAIVECKSLRDEASTTEQRNWSRSYNASTPAYVCAVLMRDFADKLSEPDKEFCREVLLGLASTAVAKKSYYGHTVDGAEPAILNLPLLLRHFPGDRENIKSLMLVVLVCQSQTEAAKFTIRAILQYLWNVNFDDAQSLFLGYLVLKPAYDKIYREARKQHYEEVPFGEFSEESILKGFFAAQSATVDKIIANEIELDHLPDLKLLDLRVLNVAFQLLPPGTSDTTHQQFLRAAFAIFAETVFDDPQDKIDYSLRRDILQKIVAIVLKTSPAETVDYIEPFLQNFSVSRASAEFLESFLWLQDSIQVYEQFWLVWNALYPRMVDLTKSGASQFYGQSIIHNYLFAWNYWNQNAKEWHTLKDREKTFFQRVANDMGHDPAVLDSMAKVLNEVASGFFEDGISWISDMLQNQELQTAELEKNTIYYLENIVRKYALLKRSVIRSSVHTKDRVLTILNFLIEKGSVVGYLLREDIL
jgi:hypothetical protein